MSGFHVNNSNDSFHFAVPVNNRFSSLAVEYVLDPEDTDPHEIVMDSHMVEFYDPSGCCEGETRAN